MKIETETRKYYRCSYCDWTYVCPEACLEHERDCCHNPANRSEIEGLAGKTYTDSAETYVKVLSANPGAIRCVILKEKTPERRYEIYSRTYVRPDEITAWARPIKEGENPEGMMDRMTGLVKKFLEGERCRADCRYVPLPIPSAWTAPTVRITLPRPMKR